MRGSTHPRPSQAVPISRGPLTGESWDGAVRNATPIFTGRTIRRASSSRGEGGISMTPTGPRTAEEAMKRQGAIMAGVAILLGILLLAGFGEASAADSSWTEWKEKLPFLLTGEVEVGGQI